MRELQSGAGKTVPFIHPDFHTIGRPVVVNGRSIRIYGWPPGEHQWLFDLVTKRNSVPDERCISYAQTPKGTVFVGMLDGKLVPFIAYDVSTEETVAIAEEFERRLRNFGKSA